MIYFLYIFYFIIGSIVGSYSNMLIYRYSYVEPIWTKSRSYCTSCKQTLKWYNLIPIFSYLFQKGKCSTCKSPIHIRYFLLELFSGLLFVFIMHNVESTISNLIFVFILLIFLIPILFIDVMMHLIYDGYLKFLMLLTLLVLFINDYIYHIDLFITLPTFKFALIGSFIIYISFILFNKIGGFLLFGDYRFDIFGMGDVKILTWVFMLLGSYQLLIVMFFLSCLVGLLLYSGHQLMFYHVHVKNKKTQRISLVLNDALKKKPTSLKIRISEAINPNLYQSFISDKKVPHTFLLSDIDKKDNILQLQSGKISWNVKVTPDVIEKIQKDKEELKISNLALDCYITCDFSFDDNNELISFEYKCISDYELYLQSILRSKTLGVEGIPFAPALIYSFFIVLIWGHEIGEAVRNYFFQIN